MLFIIYNFYTLDNKKSSNAMVSTPVHLKFIVNFQVLKTLLDSYFFRNTQKLEMYIFLDNKIEASINKDPYF